MYKKVISVLLSLVVLFGLMATAVPVYAANANEFVITPDKTEVNPGDTITYTVTIGPVVNFQSANFTLVIPEGLTFVSGTLAEGLKELTGAAEASFTESTLTFFHGGIGEYTSDQDTKLMSFVGTVDEGASGNYIIEIMDDYDFAELLNATAVKHLAQAIKKNVGSGATRQEQQQQNAPRSHGFFRTA